MKRVATQEQAILELLRSRRGRWVPLPEILPLAAQYSSRIFSLRRKGFHIENRVEAVHGVKHSWFRLALAPGVSPAARESSNDDLADSKGSSAGPAPMLFHESKMERTSRPGVSYPD